MYPYRNSHYQSQEERDERRRQQALGLLLDEGESSNHSRPCKDGVAPSSLQASATSMSNRFFLSPPERWQVDQSVNLMDVEMGAYGEETVGPTKDRFLPRFGELPNRSRETSSSLLGRLSNAVLVSSKTSLQRWRQQQYDSSEQEAITANLFVDEETCLSGSGLEERKRRPNRSSKRGKKRGKKKRKYKIKSKKIQAVGSSEDYDPSLWEEKALEVSRQEPLLYNGECGKQRRIKLSELTRRTKRNSKMKRHCKKRIRWGRVSILVFTCFVLVVIIFMILILTGQFACKKLRRRRSHQWPNLRQKGQQQTPIMERGRNHSILELPSLPESTQLLIQDKTEKTPQKQALQWIQQDSHVTIVQGHQIETQNQTSPLDTLPALQRFVLATLYYTTNGRNWKDAQHWLSYDHSECDWFYAANRHHPGDNTYAICNRYQQIHQLKLRWQGMVGTLPQEELSLLKSLKKLDIGHNQLHGVLSWTSLLSNWKHLEMLDLQHNKFSGELPLPAIWDRDSNKSLQHLHTFIANYNQFSGTIQTEIGLLVSNQKLRVLELEHNSLSGSIPTELGGNADRPSLLQTLLLNGNELTGTIPSELGLLSQLTTLQLHHNPFLQANQTMPWEICDLQRNGGKLEPIAVDCGKIDCGDCQCECMAPLQGGDKLGRNFFSLRGRRT